MSQFPVIGVYILPMYIITMPNWVVCDGYYDELLCSQPYVHNIICLAEIVFHQVPTTHKPLVTPLSLSGSGKHKGQGSKSNLKDAEELSGKQT